MGNIGKNIKVIREKNRITQNMLANNLCISQQAVNKWENGTSIPQMDRLEELSNILHTPVDAILYDNEDTCYQIPINRTTELQQHIDFLKDKLNKTVYASDTERYHDIIDLKFSEIALYENSPNTGKSGEYIIHLQVTEYEYNVFQAIKQIYPSYNADDFHKLISDGAMERIRKTRNLDNNC